MKTEALTFWRIWRKLHFVISLCGISLFRSWPTSIKLDILAFGKNHFRSRALAQSERFVLGHAYLTEFTFFLWYSWTTWSKFHWRKFSAIHVVPLTVSKKSELFNFNLELQLLKVYAVFRGLVLSLILIYSCDLLHRRGNLWGSATLCTMIETCCEAVSVSICHFVTWLLIFILSFLSAAPSLCSFFFYSPYFSSPTSLFSLLPVYF